MAKYTVISGIRTFLSSKGMQVSGDFIDEIDVKIEKLLETAAVRAEANGRKTVMRKDL